MTLELLYAGFPVLHNASIWGNYGYYYEGADLEAAGRLYDSVRQHHNNRLETYKSHARALAWRHSPYNPEIQRAWKELLEQ